MPLLWMDDDIGSPVPVSVCDFNNPLIKAISIGDIHRLEQLLANPDNNKYLNVANTYPPLHIACYVESLPCVGLLLDNEEVDLTLRDIAGLTPIHIACVTGNMEILKCLVEAFEEYVEPLCEELMDLRTDYEQSALHVAVGSPNPKEMVTYLLDHGACAISVDHRDNYPSNYCRDDTLKEMLVKKEYELSEKLEAELGKKDVVRASAER